MGTFKLISKNELRTRRKLPAEDLILFDQFKGYLGRLNGSDVVLYEFAKGEDPDLCRKILRLAAKALDVRVRVKDEAGSLVFYVAQARRSSAGRPSKTHANRSNAPA